VSIVVADKSNLKELVNLAISLFPDDAFEELFSIYEKSLTSEKEIGLLYEIDGKSAGYRHLSIRHDYVNETDTSPVAFVEAIYVLPEYRKHGIARKFIEYAENYARQKGIAQLASDCLIDNELSEKFHKSCGFVEAERVICFVKNV
jgi:aminoglycoside 6'-N-acetyltransferase I